MKLHAKFTYKKMLIGDPAHIACRQRAWLMLKKMFIGNHDGIVVSALALSCLSKGPQFSFALGWNFLD